MAGETSILDSLAPVGPPPGAILSGGASPPSFPMTAPHPAPDGSGGTTNLSDADYAKFMQGTAPPPAQKNSATSILDTLPSVAPTHAMTLAGTAKGEPTWSGILGNAAAGANQSVASALGAPVDLATWGMNLPGRAINAATGTNIPPIQNPVGGSDWIQQQWGNLTGVNPSQVQPTTEAERMARAAGGAVAQVPLMAMGGAGAAKVLGGLPAAVGEALAHAGGATAGQLAETATATGAGGAAGQLAEDTAPEPLKPVANLLGNVAGAAGTIGALRGAEQAGGIIVRKAGESGLGSNKSPVPGIRATGPQVAAAGNQVAGALGPEGQGILERASGFEDEARDLEAKIADPATTTDDSDAAKARLREIQGRRVNLVPGSEPTTAQVAPTAAAVALEKAHRVASLEQFNERAAVQNNARVAAVQGVQPEGNPGAVGDLLRSRLADIDASEQATTGAAKEDLGSATAALGATGTPEAIGEGVRAAAAPQFDSRIGAATGALRDATRDLGGNGRPEAIGEAVRDPLAAAKASRKARESALQQAIDPEGKLVVDTTPLLDAAAAVRTGIGPENWEAADPTVKQWVTRVERDGSSVPYSKFRQTWSQLSAEIRTLVDQRVDPGTAQIHWLNELKKGLHETIAQAGQDAAERDPGVAERLAVVPRDASPNEPGASSPSTGNAVYTPSGRQISVEYKVVPSGSLIPSHTDDLTPNPAYPAELQPRDRGRMASQGQVQRIASGLQPERLGASSSAMEGAPIIGSDGVVESGNARVLGIQRALTENGPRAEAYRAFLKQQGYDAAPDGILVRQRVSDLSPEDRVRFTQEANSSPGLAMSASERAGVDARRLPDSLLTLWRPGEVDSAANRNFVREFVRAVPEQGEEGAFLTPEGGLSLEGAQRIRNALLQKAYGDPNLIAALSEVGDENIKAFGGALTDAAGDMAKLRAEISAGHVSPEVDVTPHLLDAARVISQARQRRVSIKDMVGQNDMLSGHVNPLTESVLRAAYGDGLTGRMSRQKMAELLSFYAEEAQKQTSGPRLFGEPLGPEDILNQGRARGSTSQSVRSKDIFGRSGGYGPGVGSAGSEARGSGAGETGQTHAATARAIEPETAPEVKPNVTPEIADQIAANTRSYADFKNTYGTGPVGTTLRPGPGGAGFKTESAAVPRQFLTGNAVEPSRVKAYLDAVGAPEGTVAMRDALVSDLREKGIVRPDDTIDPDGFAAWIHRRGNTIDLFPGLREQLGTISEAQAAVDRVITNQGQIAEIMRPAQGGGYAVESSKVPRQFLTGNNVEPSRVKNYLDTVGTPEGVSAMRDALVSDLREKNIIQPDGTINPDSYNTWLQRRGRTVDLFPGLRDQLSNVTRAQETLDAATARHLGAVKDFQNGVAKNFLNGDEPIVAVRKAFGSGNPTDTFQKLADTVKGNPDAEAGLRRGVVDYILEKHSSTAPSGTSDVDFLKADSFRRWLRQNKEPLKVLFGGQGSQNLDMVGADLRRQAQRANATGGSDTQANRIATGKLGLAGQATHGIGITALTLIGERLGEVAGGHGIIGAVGLPVLGAGVHAMRQAGIRTVNDLVREAMLHPELARTLIQQVKGNEINPIMTRRIGSALRSAVLADMTSEGESQ